MKKIESFLTPDNITAIGLYVNDWVFCPNATSMVEFVLIETTQVA
jgi:hypothetical protein